jgi:membrane protein DedA with SNARE-associated domain
MLVKRARSLRGDAGGSKPAMTLVQLISQYGYLAVFVGALLEGEAILVLAGFAAQQGHLSLAWVLAIAFVGGTLGDQIFFWLGKHWGGALLRRLPDARERTLRVSRLLQRYDAWLVFGIRFMYGLRIAGPIAMGALGVKPRRFALFNVLGAAVWAPLIGGAGYLLGHTLERLLGDIERYESRILWTALGAMVAVYVMKQALHAWRARSTASAPPVQRDS